MRKEIIITTESINMDTISKRDKTIYDAGVEDGIKAVESYSADRPWRMVGCFVLGIVICIMTLLSIGKL
jgi:hypothetical protein